MDIGKSFTYMFDDEKWVQKLVVGGLLALVSIIPLVNIFTMPVIAGYGLRLLKNVADGAEEPLPAWDDWGGDWVKGILSILAGVIYAIPIWIVSLFSWIASYLGGYNDPSQAQGFLAFCMVVLSCLSALWGVLIAVVFPAAQIKYATEGQFGSFFRFGDIFGFIRDNLGDYIVAILLTIVAGLVGALGTILCVVGVFFTYFWSLLVGSHLYGQVKAQSAAVAADAGGAAAEA